MKCIYEIPEFNFGKFQSEINKLNKKATKLSLKPIRINILEKYEKEYFDTAESYRKDPYQIGLYDGKDFIKTTIMIKVEMDGDDPVLNGWRFIAVIEHGKDGKNLVKGLEECPKQYRIAKPDCDHCQIQRYRVKTFIVHHKDGGYKQVGSTCLKDFLGHINPHEMAKWSENFFSALQCINNDFEFEESFYSGYSRISLYSYLQCVAAVIHTRGWLSSSRARESDLRATADIAYDIFTGKQDEDLADIQSSKDDWKIVDAAVKWILEEADTKSDYMWNLRTSCERETIDYKNLRIAASLISSYQRHIEKLSADKIVDSKYQGNVGERITISPIVVISREINGEYGISYFNKMVDNGNLFIWFSSSKKLEAGKIYELVGTVKKHDTYNGTEQTILTRCKVKE